MTYEAETYGALCSLRVFTVNGIAADAEDFVDQYDHDREGADDYACGNMRADIIAATEDVLRKYGITGEEYMVIAEDIAEKLSFGSCGWCV